MLKFSNKDDYGEARRVEKSFLHDMKQAKLPLYINKSQATNACQVLCDTYFMPRLHSIFFSVQMPENYLAFYWYNQIFFKGSPNVIPVIVLLHELAHHFTMTKYETNGHGLSFVLEETAILKDYLDMYKVKNSL